MNRLPLIVAIVLLLLPVLYVLSVGPAFCLLYDGNGFYGDVFGAVYAPLIWIVNNGPAPIDDWLMNYILWWRRFNASRQISQHEETRRSDHRRDSAAPAGAVSGELFHGGAPAAGWDQLRAVLKCAWARILAVGAD